MRYFKIPNLERTVVKTTKVVTDIHQTTTGSLYGNPSYYIRRVARMPIMHPGVCKLNRSYCGDEQ